MYAQDAAAPAELRQPQIEDAREVAKPGPIPDGHERLARKIMQLHEIADALTARLAPVLRAQSQPAMIEGTPQDPDGSSMRATVDVLIGSAHQVQGTLEDLLDRLEL